jgi:hypothetical protein
MIGNGNRRWNFVQQESRIYLLSYLKLNVYRSSDQLRRSLRLGSIEKSRNISRRATRMRFFLCLEFVNTVNIEQYLIYSQSMIQQFTYYLMISNC